LRSQARVLIAIVETGNIAPAAEHLGLSPATLQRAARDLKATCASRCSIAPPPVPCPA
jgi:DNA-binding transcriptional LysR family regulator